MELAALAGQADGVLMLVTAGAAVDPVDDRGWTPASVAAGKHRPAVIDALAC